jgi:predicted ATPase
LTVPPFIRRVRLKNYKSIGACDVQLGPLTFLVGPNGAGKSNFLDALRFVADSLGSSLAHAIRQRGSALEMVSQGMEKPRHFGVRVDFALSPASTGWYAFEIAAMDDGGYTVKQEQCVVPGAHYTHVEGTVISSVETPPAAAADRLYLVNASGLPWFRPIYDALSRMGFYNLNPDRIRQVQDIDRGDVLARDGGNLASAMAFMATEDREGKRRLEEYLSKIVPGLTGVFPQGLGHKVTLAFRQTAGDSNKAWTFLASSMSDGTLRATGILAALFQRSPLIGIEEPEVALHPAAAGVLLDALREASTRTQVVVTSHSPDLLDNKSITDAELLSVLWESSGTRIGPLDEASRKALRERLYTAGEMLRMNQLEPDVSARTLTPEQLALFEDVRA